MPSKRNLIQQIQSHTLRLSQAIADVQVWHDCWLERATQKHQHDLAEIEDRYQQAQTNLRSAYEATLMRATNGIQDITQSAGLHAALWDNQLWRSWTSAADGSNPSFTRVGQLVETGQWHRLTLPALLPFPGDRALFFKATTASKTIAVQAIQSALLRLLAAIPPGKLRFTFIDPVGLGQNVAPFMHLADYDEALVTGKAWTEAQQIEQRLADLTEHMENVIQKYLRNQFATIEDYNAQAGAVAEPYRVLVVLDFPTNFSEAAARRLVSIAQNGPRCGVYAVILADTAKPLPYGFNMVDLEQTATIIVWDGNRFVWQDADFKDCLLELDAPPDMSLFDHILKAVGEAARAASRVEVPFERVAPSPEQWLGEPVAIREPVAATFRRQSGSNLLIVGQNDEAALGMLAVALISLVAQLPAPAHGSRAGGEGCCYILDFGAADAPYADYFTRLSDQIPLGITVGRRRQLPEMINKLAVEVQRRLDADSSSEPPIYLFLYGLQRARDLRQEEGFGFPSFGEEPAAPSPSQQFTTILHEGPDVGVHTLLWCDTMTNLNRSLDRRMLREFAMRVVFQISAEDSANLIDTPAASKLGPYRALFYSEDEGLLEKFRP